MDFILLIQAVLGALIIVGILLQQRAAGLTAGGTMNTMVVQRRGAEKVLYQLTGVLSTLFFLLTILHWYV